MPYDMNPRASLTRAKALLASGAKEGLFYAAFELRCCVETRQGIYAEEIEWIKSKITPWNVGKTAKQLQQVFDSEKIAKLACSTALKGYFDLYYTPVTKRLSKNVERLGDLLHAMKYFKEDNSQFWEKREIA